MEASVAGKNDSASQDIGACDHSLEVWKSKLNGIFLDQEVATARIGVSLMRGEHGPEGALQATDLDRLVDATVWTYTFKRTTGMNTSPVKFANMPATGATDVEFSGYWVKFPLDAKQTSYEVFDATLRRTAPAVYKDSQERNGRIIYHYQQKIDPTNTADLYSTFFTTIKLPIKPAPPADQPQDIEAYLFHSGVRDYYVDQISGMIVDMSENIIDYYGDRNGGKLADAHLFAGKMSNEQSAAMLAQAAQLSDGHIIRIITWVVLGLGVIVTFGTARKDALPDKEKAGVAFLRTALPRISFI